jgi:hypothetical protein
MSRWGKYQDFADLPEQAFKKLGRRMTLEGGGGGGHTTATTTTSNLPEYAKPYFEDIMNRGQAASLTPHQAYGGQRVAGFSPYQQASQGMTAGIAGAGTPQGLQTGQQIGTDVANRLGGYQFNPSQMGYQSVQAGQLGPQLSGANAANIGAFMSPYQQAVVDTEKSAALREYQIADQMRGSQAARAGAFGGSRQAVESAEAQRGLTSQLQGIQAKGSQDAFSQAQQALQAERSAGMQAGTTNLQAALQAAQNNQQAAMEAQRGTEASRQFSATTGLQAMQQLGAQGQQLGAMGEAEQKLAFDRAQALGGVGKEQQAMQQQQYDQSYADFAAQRDYEQNMINWYNNILRGTPVEMNKTVYAPAPSAASQMAGLGLAGLGAYRSGQGSGA